LKPSEEDWIPKDLMDISALGRPIVGIVGQINNTYDWEMLEAAAETNQQMQLVFIGNLFEEGEVTERIKSFFKRDNVHWLGAKPHNDLKGYIDNFDILLNPLAINPQNDRR
ncbi:MAG: glycosyltransferase, partial [bacterium]